MTIKTRTHSKETIPKQSSSLSPKDEFIRIMTDHQAFDRAAQDGKLYELIPELNSFEIELPEDDPNIYRPMPMMQHTFESIRHAFNLTTNFGADEYQSSEAKTNAVLWINCALLFHDFGETALIKEIHLPAWRDLAAEWCANRERNILTLKETYPFFGPDTAEARSYIRHLLHPEISALLADDFLARFEFSSRELSIVDFLIRNQSVLIEKATYGRTKDGRTLHEDFYGEIDAIEKATGVPKDDLLKMLQVLQLADANAVRPGMAQIPQVTLMRVWMAYDYLRFVIMVRSSPERYQAFMNYRDLFGRIRKEKPFGTPFRDLFNELLRRIESEDGGIDESEKRILEQHLQYFETFRIIKEDHIYINDQFNQLLVLIEITSGRKLPPKDKALLLTAYKVAYRSHDGHSRRQLKTVPVGDVRRKFIEHPIRVAKIMVDVFRVTDPVVLATLLLHDVLEDTDTHMDDIKAAFHKYDGRERILKALELLTRTEVEGLNSQTRLLQETDYLRYVAATITAGDKILPDMELFDWLRLYVPLSKASDKIHNRRTLMGRKPKGRIEEICRNGNTLVMFMEASILAPEQKLKLLKEFDKSLLEIFDLIDLKKKENLERFLALLGVFLKETLPAASGARFAVDSARHRLDAFAGEAYTMFYATARDPAKDPRVQLLLFELQTLPAFLKEMRLDKNETAAVMDEFTIFLFDVSEVSWLKGKRNILKFQRVIRWYREQISKGEWKPELPGIIEELARYSQGDRNVQLPLIRSDVETGPAGNLPEMTAPGPLPDCPVDHDRERKAFVAGLLPRLAMLPLRHIYWLEDDEVKRIERTSVEQHIGGITVTRQKDNRLVIHVHKAISPHRLPIE
ncbi:MAG TPA: hypothetical protein VLL97_10325 [Acidobacteriota bacterium]|nr:hypothetical protein [Acidobacteriota bacterium]